MRLTVTCVLFVLALALSRPAAAQWQRTGEIGIVFSRGNANQDSANLKLDGSRTLGNWKNTIGLAALRAASEDARTAERYVGTWQSDFGFTDRAYVFGGLRHELDAFSGFDYQASGSAGLGYRFADSALTRFSAQAGIGYRRSRRTNAPVPEREVIFRGGATLEHALTSSTRLVGTLLVESGADNTFASNELTLQVEMTQRLALALGLGLRHNTRPPAGLRNTEALTTVNLVYAF